MNCSYEFTTIGAEIFASIIGFVSIQKSDESSIIIDQLFVWPTVRKQGVGARLIEAIHHEFDNRNDVLHVIPRNPNIDMQRVSRYVHVKLLETLSEFSADKLEFGVTRSMIQTASRKFKISPMDACFAYEILYFNHTQDQGPVREEYEKAVKRRLHLAVEDQIDNLNRLLNGEREKVDWHSTKLSDETYDQLDDRFKVNKKYNQNECQILTSNNR